MCGFSDDADGYHQRVAEVLGRQVEEWEEERKIEDDALYLHCVPRYDPKLNVWEFPKMKNSAILGDNNKGSQFGIHKSRKWWVRSGCK